ncbi:Hypothetical protein FKW44_016277 [Caligus rogercresseyi]|uniref:Uncharacterized protein n=1 Tax=Caligus rogercresseyi TaxID=217165 RepID=A0A7T8H1L8_CALRO|nr:Hypothetical protein FKW44_016277 [Caligus rogercresseyi]
MLQTGPDGDYTRIQDLSVGDYLVDPSSGRDTAILDMKVKTRTPDDMARQPDRIVVKVANSDGSPFLLGSLLRQNPAWPPPLCKCFLMTTPKLRGLSQSFTNCPTPARRPAGSGMV